MKKQALETIKKYHMLEENDCVVIAISGGADSCALFHVLCDLQEQYKLILKAVHVNHGLRGAQAERDAAFVQALCKSKHVELWIERHDVRAYAKEHGLGEEEAGREIRYQCFAQAATFFNAQKIAVAHNQNDVAETVLMRLCRGTGLKGLAGIKPVRGKVIRPLLACPREDIEAYCTQHAIAYCTDTTNAQQKYTRNRVRLSILPLLEQIHVGSVEHIAGMATLLLQEEEYLENQTALCFKQCLLHQTEGVVTLSVEKLKALHPAMQSRVLREAVFQLNHSEKNITNTHIDSLCGLLYQQTGKGVDVAGGVRVQKSYGALCMSLVKQASITAFCYSLEVEKTIFLKEINKYAVLSLNEEKNVEFDTNRCTKAFDYDKIKNINNTIEIRTRKPGDYIRRKAGTKKLKDLLIDKKIPRAHRQALPVVALGSEILWAVGVEAAAGFLADGSTKKRFYIHLWEEDKRYEGECRGSDQ